MKEMVFVFVLGLALVVPGIVGQRVDLDRRVQSLEQFLNSIRGNIDLVPKNNDRFEKALEDEIRLRSSEMGSANRRITELENQNILLKAAVADLELKFNQIQKGNEEFFKQFAPPTQVETGAMRRASGVALPSELQQQMSAWGGMNGMAFTPEIVQQISGMGGTNGMAPSTDSIQTINVQQSGGSSSFALQGQVHSSTAGEASSFVPTRESIKKTCPQTLGQGWTCSWSDFFGCYCIFVDAVGKTLQEAKSLCERLGVQLVAIESAEEQEYVANQLSKLLYALPSVSPALKATDPRRTRTSVPNPREFKNEFWTSGYYTGGQWKWASTNHSVDFTTWIGGKIDRVGKEIFMSMNNQQPFNWYNAKNEDRLNTICEGPPLPTSAGSQSPATKSCPKNVGSHFNCKQIDGFGCYCASMFQETSEMAGRRCRQYGMELVSIETEEENVVIRAFLKQIGYRNPLMTSGTNAKRDGNWIWSTTGQKVTYTSWKPEEVNNQRDILLIDWNYPNLWTGAYNTGSRLNQYFMCEL